MLLASSALIFWGGALVLMGHRGVLAYAILPAAAFLLPSVAWAELRGVVPLAFPSRRPSWRGAAEAAALLLGASLLALALAGALSGAPGSSREEEELRNLVLGVPAPSRLLLFALLPALCEEALFRGALLACLARWGTWRAALVSALVFALFHGSAVRFVPVALLGIALALVVQDTRNLWLAVAGHAAHNAVILLAVSSSETGGNPPLSLVAVLAVAGLGLCALGLWLRPREPAPADHPPANATPAGGEGPP